MRRQLVQLVDRILEGLLDGHEGGAGPEVLVGDGEDLAFRLLEELSAVATVGGEGARGDFRSDIDQLPQNRALTDYFGVGAHICRTGRACGQLTDVGTSIDLVHQPV